MTFDERTPYLLITDPCYKTLLLKKRSDFPHVDIKILSREDAVSAWTYALAMDPIPYLLSLERYNYSDIKSLLDVLLHGSLDAETYLAKLRQRLIEDGAIRKDPLASLDFQKRKVLLFEADEDVSLRTLLSARGVSFEDVHFADLGFPEKGLRPEIDLFSDKIDQFCAVFADIRKRVVRGKEKAEDFQILVHDNQDRYFLSLFSDLFAIPVFFDHKYPLLSDEKVKAALATFKRQGRIHLDEAEDDTLKRLDELIKHYGLENLSFDYAFTNLMEIVKSESIMGEKNDGIVATTDVPFDTQKRYYVTNFQHGDFYAVFSDKGLFQDEALRQMGLNTSYDRTKIDRRKKINFFRYMDVVSYSRVELHLSDKIFPSQLLTEVPAMRGEKPYHEKKIRLSKEGLFTTEAAAFALAMEKDFFFAKPDKTYRNYDSSYKTISDFHGKSEFGASEFDGYYDCPFRYYLEKILKLDDKEPETDFFARAFGTLVHKVYEDVYDEKYDFDNAFDEGYKKFLEEFEQKGMKATPREKTLAKLSKAYLRRFVDNVRNQRPFMQLHEAKHESKIDLKLTSAKTNREYMVKGRIDRILYTVHGDTVYYSILDYKTNNTVFDYRTVFLGNSLQLPLYALALQKEEEGKTFGLIGIQKVFKKGSLKDDQTDSYDSTAIAKYMKVRGMALDSVPFFQSIDETAIGKDKVAAKGGTYIGKDLSFRSDEKTGLKKGLFYSAADLFDDAQKAAIETMDNVSDACFPIKPNILKANEQPACSYCAYRDICFRKNDDIVARAEDVRKHLGSFLADDDNDEEDA